MHTSSLVKCFTIRGNTQLTLVRALSVTNNYKGKNHYKTLELKNNCSDKEVRDAYIRLSKEHHPDRNPNAVKDDKRFVEINEAYSVLGKPAARRRYDTYLNSFDPPREQQFSSSYEELTYHYNYYQKYHHQRRNQKPKKEVPLNKLLFVIISAMFVVGILEFQIVKRVVQGPDEIVDGVPVYHSNVLGPDLSLMNEQQVDAYNDSKRRIIENTVRSMKAENDARQRDQERVRTMIENNSQRRTSE